MTLIMVLHRLFEMPNFKIEGYVVSADGFSYDFSACAVEEGLIDAYLTLSACIRAKEMVKKAKITL